MHPHHVYVHVPFCARRCTYCDFAIAVRRDTPVDEYLVALASELDLRYPHEERWEVDTLYLGGGTPSRLGGAGIARLLDVLRERLALAPGAEVTLEANPDDVDADAVVAWRDAGITRVSVGAQSFDDTVLQWMHRTHDARAIGAAVDALRGGGLDDVSLDLIFALPVEVSRDWSHDLASALALEPTHLSLYGLTVEPRTPLGRWADRGNATEADDEQYADEYLLAAASTAGAGLEHYEVSNFARPGFASRHNSSYWRGVPYAGLGPGAHEFDGESRRWNVSGYTEWLRRVGAGEDPMRDRECLDASNRAVERVYLGLRTREGLAVDDREMEHAQPWIESGWAVERPNGRLVLTAQGWLRLDSLAADLTVVRSH